MKQLLFLLLIFCSLSSIAQKITDLPAATGTGIGGVIPIVQGGVTKRIFIDSLPKTDTSSIYLKLTQTSAALAGKQNNLVSGINLATVNGVSLLTPNNITIAGASAKPLYKNLTLVPGGTTLFNFDSSSTAKLTTSGLVNIDITGSVPIGSTGVLAVTQSATGNDTLKYNGIIINIGKIANKTSLVGFYKRDIDFVFSVDTTANIIAQTGAVVAGVAGGSYDSSSVVLFAAAGTNTTYKTAVDNAIKGLKAITLAAGGTAWSKSIMINGRAGSSLAQQAYNWRNPAQYNYAYIGTFTYNANGTQFDGAANYLNTGLVPSLTFAGTTSDVAVINVVGAAPTQSGIFFGVLDLTTPTLFFKQFLNTGAGFDIRTALNFASYAVTPVPITGRYVSFYSTATTFNQYKNGTLLDTRAVTPSVAFAHNAIYEGAVSDESNAPGNFTNPRIDVTQVINSKLTVAEAQAIDAVWATYQTALSR